jgi:hypothetical protein
LVFDAGSVQSQANGPITARSLPSRTVGQEVLANFHRESGRRSEVDAYLSRDEAAPAISCWHPIDSMGFHLAQSLRPKNDMSNGCR